MKKDEKIHFHGEFFTYGHIMLGAFDLTLLCGQHSKKLEAMDSWREMVSGNGRSESQVNIPGFNHRKTNPGEAVLYKYSI